MFPADDLQRLSDLHRDGHLNDDEFSRAKGRILGDGAAAAALPPIAHSVNAFRRSRSDRWIGGVCGGIARVTGVESWIWRLIFFALLLFGGTGVLLYVLLWIFVPSE